MSINNLYSEGSKSWQNINVNDIQCKTLTAQNIIGDISDPDARCNTISSFDTGNVQFNDPIQMAANDINDVNVIQANEKVFITDGSGDSPNECQLHIQSNNNACIFLEGDVDNITESDTAYIWMSQDGGYTALNISNLSAATPGTNIYSITAGSVSGSDRGVLFRTGISSLVSPGTVPNLTNLTNTLYVGDTGNVCYQNLDMFSKNITDAANIISDNFYLSTTVGKCAQYTKNGLAIAMNTDTLLSGWTAISTSTDIDFDITTGVITPGDGVYSAVFQATASVFPNKTEMGARLQRDDNITIYQSIITSNDLMEAENGGFQGAQFENLVGCFLPGHSYRIFVKYSAAGTFNYSLQLFRIM